MTQLDEDAQVAKTRAFIAMHVTEGHPEGEWTGCMICVAVQDAKELAQALRRETAR